jgi:diguanylate cyclase (GGDEF)-like protein
MSKTRLSLTATASQQHESNYGTRWRTYQFVFIIASIGMIPLILSGRDLRFVTIAPLVLLSVGFAVLAVIQGILQRVSPALEQTGFIFGTLMYLYRFIQVSYLIGIGIVPAEALGDIFPWVGVIYIGAFVVFRQRQSLIVTLSTMAVLGLSAFLLLLNSPHLRAIEPIVDLIVSSAIMILLLTISRRMIEAGVRAEARAEAMRQLATRDSLTGLYNRRYLDEKLTEEFARAVRYKHPLSVAIFDIDGFKEINDQYSHDIGDKTLKTIARLLLDNVREVDIVARFGGEEFVVVLLETPLEGARRVCETLCTTIAEYNWQSIHPELTVTISAGISADISVNNHERLLHLADIKLYEAKQQGKNRVCV